MCLVVVLNLSKKNCSWISLEGITEMVAEQLKLPMHCSMASNSSEGMTVGSCFWGAIKPPTVEQQRGKSVDSIGNQSKNGWLMLIVWWEPYLSLQKKRGLSKSREPQSSHGESWPVLHENAITSVYTPSLDYNLSIRIYIYFLKPYVVPVYWLLERDYPIKWIVTILDILVSKIPYNHQPTGDLNTAQM